MCNLLAFSMQGDMFPYILSSLNLRTGFAYILVFSSSLALNAAGYTSRQESTLHVHFESIYLTQHCHSKDASLSYVSVQ